MKSTLVHRLRGFVLIEAKGGEFEVLLNRLTQQRMSVWDIRYLGESHAELCMTVADFFRLRPLVRNTGTRLRVLERHGMPFLLDKLERRKFFAIGLLGFVIGVYLLSSLVWKIEVYGNEKLSADMIIQAAKEQGIYTMQWKHRLPQPETMARSLQSRLPGTAWVGVKVQGTRVIINVEEATVPDKSPLMNPRHLVASKNALVTEIFAEKGRPAVKLNTYVRKGDILISGYLGDETNRQTVVASGKVRGIVWYKPQVEIPLTRQYKVYTGESKRKSYLVLGSRALQLTGYGAEPYAQSETLADRKTLSWRNWALPIGWLSEKVMEVNVLEQSVDPKEAEATGMEQARAQITAEAGADAKVVSEKILHEKTENGKVYMEVLLEVEEFIAVEQPIVPET